MTDVIKDGLHDVRDGSRRLINQRSLIERYRQFEFSVHMHFSWKFPQHGDCFSVGQRPETCIRLQALPDPSLAVESKDSRGLGYDLTVRERESGPDGPRVDQDYMERSVLVSVIEGFEDGERFGLGIPSVVRLQSIHLPLNVRRCGHLQRWPGESGLFVYGLNDVDREGRRLLTGRHETIPARQEMSQVVESRSNVVQNVADGQGNGYGWWADFSGDDLKRVFRSGGLVADGWKGIPLPSELMQCRFTLDYWDIGAVVCVDPDFLPESVEMFRGAVDPGLNSAQRVG